MSERVKLKPSDYVHLHNHTQYSLLDGLTKVPALIDRVKEMGMEAVAMTDHGTMSGVIEFYKAANAGEIKPIIGMEAYVAPRTYKDKDPGKDRQYFHLTLLAMNNEGYQNLMRLSSIANLEGFYYKPRIDHDLIEKYNAGLIVLSGCIGGEVSDALREGQYDQAKKTAEWYKKVFGDRYYIEIMDHGHPEHPSSWAEQDRVNNDLLKLSKELDIPAVLTCDAHYLNHEDQEAHEILLCVQTGAFLTDENRFSLKDFHLHVADPKEIIERWEKIDPNLITNSKKIADRCRVDIELGEILIPKFPTPNGESEKQMLDKLIWQGLAWRYGGKTRDEAVKLSITQAKKLLSPEIIERAEYEMGVVDSMGFNGYFLIVQDFINWGKDRGIVFGPGRGSAAGSIMAYGLRITELNPLEFDLLFERFLNPDRISMPDMDIDIQDTRREEVIEYCVDKYGREQVANIVTFGRMAARNSVRDVARVLQVPYAEADRLAKMIPPPIQGRHIPLTTSLTENSDLKTENEKNEQSARVFDLATRLEGTIRSHGVHAAGVVIAPEDIVKYTPLEVAQKGSLATQYSMGPIEELGLLKMDFLGLSNLTIIKNALRIVKKVYGKDIDILSIPMDDPKTFKLFQNGDTTGVFQFESAGMKRYLRQLKPTVFEDLVAMNALYRPGPMQWIEDFISRKTGKKEIEYMHPAMEPALKSTYGVIVYQEQVMQISKEMCGFTGGQADTMRKAIGKKIPEVMKKLKKDFIEGGVKTSGAERKLMERFWGQLEDFAAYCFNKSHAACYALIAYQTAYLKSHYPAAFMAALMTSDYDDTDRLAIEITECKHMGINVLPPDINESFHEFAVVKAKEQVRFGLDAIKNVGHGAVEEILRAREANGGRFNSLEDFCKHVNARICNRKALESLVKAGAFDSFGDRGVLYNNLENILNLSNKIQKDAASGQVDLFGESDVVSEMALKLTLDTSGPVASAHEQLGWERELLGLYLSRNPLEAYQEILESKATPVKEIFEGMDGLSVTVGGFVSDIREITTKNGSKMAFVKLEDISGEIELVLFPKTYLKSVDIWQRDKVILARGKVGGGRASDRGSEVKILVDDAVALSPEDAAAFAKDKKSFNYNLKDKPVRAARTGSDPVVISRQRLYLRLEDSKNQELLMSLKEKLDGHKGRTEVVLVTGPQDNKQIIKLPQTIDINEQCLRDLAAIFGSTNVVVR
ncbi:MAG TPA: DNA polymerase III subunit alpha [Candidatus Saccharimonadales bacterium]|nr:DNA polymerase III subunit alpha [Candidatus Saccharimonadales bacterium]